jgi:hypothetical protein
MFNRIENAYVQAANKIGLDPEKDIIPVGKAIQLAKDEYGFGDYYIQGDNLSRYDKCANGAIYNDSVDHLNARGRYIAACVWAEKIFGVDCRNTTCAESGIFSDDETMVLRQIAHEVVTGEVQCVEGDWRAVPDKVEEVSGVKLVHYMGEVPADGVITIPENWGGQKIIGIDETAFKYVEGVKKVIMPNTIFNIEEDALKKIETEYYSVKSDEKKDKDDNNGKNGGGNAWIYFVIGGAVVIIAGAVVFILLKKKSVGKSMENV